MAGHGKICERIMSRIMGIKGGEAPLRRMQGACVSTLPLSGQESSGKRKKNTSAGGNERL